jgi:hypothetical protein
VLGDLPLAVSGQAARHHVRQAVCVSIAELGSIGELLAAIATIATLAYLALQIRQSNRSHQLAAIARVGESTEKWIGQVVLDPELLDIYLRGLGEPASMSREQRARFNLLVMQLLRGTETGWLQVEWGLLDPDYWNGYRETIRSIVGSDAGRRAFAQNRRLLSRRFAAELDKILSNDSSRVDPES